VRAHPSRVGQVTNWSTVSAHPSLRPLRSGQAAIANGGSVMAECSGRPVAGGKADTPRSMALRFSSAGGSCAGSLTRRTGAHG
jgi:hypothetical protein